MTYGVALLRCALAGQMGDPATGVSLGLGLAVTIGFAAVTIGLSVMAATRETKHSLA